jgi:hypothetical protein
MGKKERRRHSAAQAVVGPEEVSAAEKYAEAQEDAMWRRRMTCKIMVKLAIGFVVWGSYFSALETIPRWKVERTRTTNDNRQWSDIVIIKNFLPLDMAERLYKELETRREKLYWQHQELESEQMRGGEDSEGFMFSTPYDRGTEHDGGTESGNNFKLVSNENIKARFRLAANSYLNKQFSFSKFELGHENNIVKEFKDFLALPEITRGIESVFFAKGHNESTHPTTLRAATHGDVEVNFWGRGSFWGLKDNARVPKGSPYANAAKGDISLTLSMTKEWEQGDGGGMQYFCKHINNYCKELWPEFNSAIIHLTKPQDLNPRVSQIISYNDKARRYDIHGWYEYVTGTDEKVGGIESLEEDDAAGMDGMDQGGIEAYEEIEEETIYDEGGGEETVADFIFGIGSGGFEPDEEPEDVAKPFTDAQRFAMIKDAKKKAEQNAKRLESNHQM